MTPYGIVFGVLGGARLKSAVTTTVGMADLLWHMADFSAWACQRIRSHPSPTGSDSPHCVAASTAVSFTREHLSQTIMGDHRMFKPADNRRAPVRLGISSLLVFFGHLVSSSNAASASGPLQVSRENPRYFADGKGQVRCGMDASDLRTGPTRRVCRKRRNAGIRRDVSKRSSAIYWRLAVGA